MSRYLVWFPSDFVKSFEKNLHLVICSDFLDEALFLLERVIFVYDALEFKISIKKGGKDINLEAVAESSVGVPTIFFEQNIRDFVRIFFQGFQLIFGVRNFLSALL